MKSLNKMVIIVAFAILMMFTITPINANDAQIEHTEHQCQYYPQSINFFHRHFTFAVVADNTGHSHQEITSKYFCASKSATEPLPPIDLFSHQIISIFTGTYNFKEGDKFDLHIKDIGPTDSGLAAVLKPVVKQGNYVRYVMPLLKNRISTSYELHVYMEIPTVTDVDNTSLPGTKYEGALYKLADITLHTKCNYQDKLASSIELESKIPVADCPVQPIDPTDTTSPILRSDLQCMDWFHSGVVCKPHSCDIKIERVETKELEGGAMVMNLHINTPASEGENFLVSYKHDDDDVTHSEIVSLTQSGQTKVLYFTLASGISTGWLSIRISSQSSPCAVETMHFHRTSGDEPQDYVRGVFKPNHLTTSHQFQLDLHHFNPDGNEFKSLKLLLTASNSQSADYDTINFDLRFRVIGNHYSLIYTFQPLKAILPSSLSSLDVVFETSWSESQYTQLVFPAPDITKIEDCGYTLSKYQDDITMESTQISLLIDGVKPNVSIEDFEHVAFLVINLSSKTLRAMFKTITEIIHDGRRKFLVTSEGDIPTLSTGYTDIILAAIPGNGFGINNSQHCSARYTNILPACPRFVPRFSFNRQNPSATILHMELFDIPPLFDDDGQEDTIDVFNIKIVPHSFDSAFNDCEFNSSTNFPNNLLRSYGHAALHGTPNLVNYLHAIIDQDICQTNGKHDYIFSYNFGGRSCPQTTTFFTHSDPTSRPIVSAEDDHIHINIPHLPWDASQQARTLVDKVEISTDKATWTPLCYTIDPDHIDSTSSSLDIVASSSISIPANNYYVRVLLRSESNQDWEPVFFNTAGTTSIGLDGMSPPTINSNNESSVSINPVEMTVKIDSPCHPITHSTYIKNNAQYYQYGLHTSDDPEPFLYLDMDITINMGTYTTSMVPMISNVYQDFTNMQTKAHLPFIFAEDLPSNKNLYISATLMTPDDKLIPSSTFTHLTPLSYISYTTCQTPCIDGYQCEQGICVHKSDLFQQRCDKLACPKLFSKNADCTLCECTTTICRALTRTVQLNMDDVVAYTDKYHRIASILFNQHFSSIFKQLLRLNQIEYDTSHPRYNQNPPHDAFYKHPFTQFNDIILAKESVFVHFMNPTAEIKSHKTILLTISMQFPAEISWSDVSSRIEDRFTVLQERLQYIVEKGTFRIRETSPFYPGFSLSFTTPQPIHFIKYNRPTSTLPYGNKMTTLCQVIGSTAKKFSSLQPCPLPTPLLLSNSKYWSECKIVTGNVKKFRHIEPICVDLYNRLHSPSTAPWCGPGYPNYPAITQTTLGCEGGGDSIGSKDALINQSLPIKALTLIDSSSTGSTDLIKTQARSTHLISFTYPIENAPNDYTIDVLFRLTPTSYSEILTTVSVTANQAIVTIPSGSISDNATIILRCTQYIAYQSKPINFKIISSDNDDCDNCQDNSSCIEGECVCNSGFSLVVDQESLAGGEIVPITEPRCVSHCEQCADDITCNGQDKTICPTCPFDNDGDVDWCTYYNGCTINNIKCENNGYHTFDINSEDKCSQSCHCIGGWGGIQCQTCQLDNESNQEQKCNIIGTDMTKSLLLCDKCHCYPGFTGKQCEIANVFGHVSFIFNSDVANVINNNNHNNTSDVIQFFQTTDSNKLSLTQQGRGVLIRDVANSIGLGSNGINIIHITVDGIVVDLYGTDANTDNNVIQQYKKYLPLSSLSTSTNNIISFAIDPTQSSISNLDALLNGWDNMSTTFDDLPIVASYAQVEVGTPEKASQPLVASEETLCSEFRINCPPNDDDGTNLGLILGVVFGIVGIVVVFIIFLVLLCYCKKNQKCCFEPKKKNSSSKKSSGKQTDNTEMTMTGSTTAQGSTTTATGQSSTASSAVDLVRLDDNEASKLPSGWTKMQHMTTGQVLYVNQSEMISQKNSPLEADTGNGW